MASRPVAVDDELIPKNPCKAASVRRPRSDLKKIVPWTRERVLAVHDELPERYQLVAWLGAGLGLRQGEIFALSPDDIDFETGEWEQQTDLPLVAGIVRDAVQAGKLVAPDRLVTYLDPLAARRNEPRRGDGRSLANDLFELAGVSPEGWDRDRP